MLRVIGCEARLHVDQNCLSPLAQARNPRCRVGDWRWGAVRLGLRPSLRGELLVELPLPSLLHETPNDDEPLSAVIVYEEDVHGGVGRHPRYLLDGQAVD